MDQSFTCYTAQEVKLPGIQLQDTGLLNAEPSRVTNRSFGTRVAERGPILLRSLRPRHLFIPTLVYITCNIPLSFYSPRPSNFIQSPAFFTTSRTHSYTTLSSLLYPFADPIITIPASRPNRPSFSRQAFGV
ncbi:hypothetical protein IAS59_002499 [Cryptococcus gattii]